MGVIAVVLVVFVALLVASNTWLQSTSYEVSSARIPAAFDGYCIVQISDLHNSRFGAGQSRLIRAVRAAHPDLIAVTGDLASPDWRRALSSQELIRRLPALAPVFFVTGNHEIYSRDLPGLVAFLEGLGVRVLPNSSTSVERGGQAIVLAGVNDLEAFAKGRRSWTASLGAWRSALTELRKSIAPERYVILLSHRPEFIQDYAQAGFDLVLTGHAHGGQIRLPFFGPLYAPGQGRLPRFTSGTHTLSGTTLVVSRGLGRGMSPLRFLNRPEVVIVRLKAGGG